MLFNSKIFKKITRKINLRKKEISLSFDDFNKKIKKIILMNWTYPKKILLGLLIILIIGACLLYNPAAYNCSSYEYVNNEFIFKYDMYLPDSNEITVKTFKVSFIEALFLSASAFTNTGFSLINIGKQLSFFGQFVIFTLIELGGFGWASFFYLIGKALKKITHKNIFSSAILNIERGGTKITQSPAMIVRIFFVIVIIQIFFAFILSGLFYSLPFYEQQNISLWESPNITSTNNVEYLLSVNSSKLYFTYQDYANSFWAGIFMSASSLNNAGIDLFGTNSLEIFRNDNGIIILSFVLIMFTIGGIGFPVIYDINIKFSWYWNYYVNYRLFHKRTYSYFEKPKFSSFSKICLSTSLIMLAIVVPLVFMSEYISPILNCNQVGKSMSIVNCPSILYDKFGKIYYPFGHNAEVNKNFSLFFISMSTRASAGFSTLNLQNFNEATIWILIFSIFIGASPSSTGGGIRVTTIAILFRSIMGLLKGVNKVSLFKRNIPGKNIIYAFVVLIVSIGLILLVSLVMYWTTDKRINMMNNDISNIKNLYSYSYFIFESVSAFGTSGLSSGVIYVNNFGWWNILLLIILMFVGQMGMYTALTSFSRKIPKKKESYYLEEYVRIA